jgi:hypothetical protein
VQWFFSFDWSVLLEENEKSWEFLPERISPPKNKNVYYFLDGQLTRPQKGKSGFPEKIVLSSSDWERERQLL